MSEYLIAGLSFIVLIGFGAVLLFIYALYTYKPPVPPVVEPTNCNTSHNFQARYHSEPIGEPLRVHIGTDWCGESDLWEQRRGEKKTYIYDVCTRCGMITKL